MKNTETNCCTDDAVSASTLKKASAKPTSGLSRPADRSLPGRACAPPLQGRSPGTVGSNFRITAKRCSKQMRDGSRDIVPHRGSSSRLVEEPALVQHARPFLGRDLDVARGEQEDLVGDALHAPVQRIRETACEIDQPLLESSLSALWRLRITGTESLNLSAICCASLKLRGRTRWTLALPVSADRNRVGRDDFDDEAAAGTVSRLALYPSSRRARDVAAAVERSACSTATGTRARVPPVSRGRPRPTPRPRQCRSRRAFCSRRPRNPCRADARRPGGRVRDRTACSLP